MDALVAEELPEVEDGRRVVGEERLEPLGVPLVGETLVRVARVGRVGSALGEQPAERLVAGRGTNSSTSTPGGTTWTRSTWPTTSSSTSRMCSEPTKTASAPASDSRPHVRELAVPAHRVLELRAVRLDRVPGAGRRSDRPSEQDVVREDEVGRQVLAERGGVRLDVAFALARGQLRQQACASSPS